MPDRLPQAHVPPLLSTDNDTALRTALAINRGMQLLGDEKFMAQFNSLSNNTLNPSVGMQGSADDLYYKVHERLFADWPESSTRKEPGGTRSGDVRSSIRTALAGNRSEGKRGLLARGRLLDNNNRVYTQTPEKIADILAEFYEDARQIRLFDVGNKITLDFFLTGLLNSDVFKAVAPYEKGFDFRRLNEEDRMALETVGASHETLKTAFLHAMDSTLTPRLHNPENGFKPFADNHIEIDGINFLSYTDPNTQKIYLVTVNGGLVDINTPQKDGKNIEQRLTEHFQNDGMVSEFRVAAGELDTGAGDHGYLPGTQEIREKIRKQSSVDGIPVDENSAPLFCLNIDILTGLRDHDLGKFNALFDNVSRQLSAERPELNLPERPSLFTLGYSNEGSGGASVLAQRLKAEAQRIDEQHGDEKHRMSRIVGIACERLASIVKQMDNSKNEILEEARKKTGLQPNVTPRPPKFFMSMGGAGAGKSSAEDILNVFCKGEGYVQTSLDDFRNFSDLYNILKAANHHADDYKVVERMASTLRNWVADAARENSHNVFYDGSGIDYQPRYAQIVDQFVKKDYRADICCVDTLLEDGKNPALERVADRFTDVGRAVPWDVVVGKHMHLPDSFLDALRDKNVSKLSLISNDAPKGQHHLVAESFTMSSAQLEEMKAAKNAGTLKGHMEHLMHKNPDSLLAQLEQRGAGTVDDWIKRNTQFSEDNVGFLAFRENGGDQVRALAIYDVARMAKMAEKAQLNPHASSAAGLKVPSEKMAFVSRIESQREPSWQSALRGR